MTSSPGTIQGYWLSDFDVESLGSLLPRLAIKHEIEQLKMKRSDYCIKMCMVFVFHFSMSLYLLVLSCVIRFPSLAPILSLIISIFPFLITSYSVIFFYIVKSNVRLTEYQIIAATRSAWPCWKTTGNRLIKSYIIRCRNSIAVGRNVENFKKP